MHPPLLIHRGLLADILPQVKLVLFVGRRSSDHLRELARIAEARGRLAYRIEQASELQPRWFAQVHAVGLVVGAADLGPVVRAVEARLHQFSLAKTQNLLEGIAQ